MAQAASKESLSEEPYQRLAFVLDQTIDADDKAAELAPSMSEKGHRSISELPDGFKKLIPKLAQWLSRKEKTTVPQVAVSVLGAELAEAVQKQAKAAIAVAKRAAGAKKSVELAKMAESLEKAAEAVGPMVQSLCANPNAERPFQQLSSLLDDVAEANDKIRQLAPETDKVMLAMRSVTELV